MLPKDACVLIPRTFEYVKLPAKGELKLQVELRFSNQLTLK